MRDPVSFRGRLTLFFLLIVVLPMIAVAVLVTQVTSKSGSGKADARLASSMDAALALYRDDVTGARRAAGKFASDPQLAAALRSSDTASIQAIAAPLARRNGIRALEIRGPGGQRLAKVGGTDAIATYRLKLQGPSGPLGTLIASTTTPSEYLN